MSNILVTGGTGYIGSHAVVALTQAGYQPVIVDNLSNSKASVVQRIARITGKKPPFYKLDLRNNAALEKVFRRHAIFSVMHFAGLKAVGESVECPLLYYENNILGTISLCNVMADRGVKNIIFSSSASVYGDASVIPIKEDCPTAPTNPYARTKLMIEHLLEDIQKADPVWRVMLLRYFNPVGAHPSGLIGEDPRGIPNNLMPFISQVAVGRRKRINVFGNDYPTKDGTGVRDYIHVMDLAEGHVAALKKMEKKSAGKPGQKPLIVNLGTGRGYSVIEMIKAFEKASGRKIPYRFTKRRSGDIAEYYADTKLALKALGWKAKRNLADMCADVWRWQSQNPEGYE
ncbi:MAG TPA: UDP-glucose 4-epimerase GalE [Smithella sp.]|nr:UDP-glucose 4-epimerase GalE [Smithella sp.]